MLTDDPDYNKYKDFWMKPTEYKKGSSPTGALVKDWADHIIGENEQTKEEKTSEVKQEQVPDPNKEKLENYLLGLLEKTSTGFSVVLVMYVIAFAVGIGLIISALILALQNGGGTNNVLSVFFGTAGTIDIVLLMYKPAREIQRSRANASKLAASVSEWFSISRGLDVAYKKLLTEGNIKNNANEIKQIVELRKNITIDLVAAMDNVAKAEDDDKTGKKP